MKTCGWWLTFCCAALLSAYGTPSASAQAVDRALSASLTAGESCTVAGDCSAGEVCCLAGFLGTCTALQPGAACPLPDLVVDADTALASLSLSSELFSEGSCAIEEGCVSAPGTRRLLRFGTETANLGDTDIILGDPSGQPGFEFSACHGHYHFEGYAEYQLLTLTGQVAASGHKQAFCLLDSVRVRSDAAVSPRYNCEFQGIQAGWSDVYGADLDCQWVDVTNVPPGGYRLRIIVNPERTLPESNFDNNVAEIALTITSNGEVIAGLPAVPGLTYWGMFLLAAGLSGLGQWAKRASCASRNVKSSRLPSWW